MTSTVRTAQGLVPSATPLTTVSNTPFPTGAPAGKLLLFWASGDKTVGALNTPTDNTGAGTWNLLGNTYIAASVSGALWWKESVGGETTVTVTYTTAHYATCLLQETDLSSPALDAFAAPNGTETPVTSIATGTTGTTTASTFVVAGAGVDSNLSWGPEATNQALAWTNSFTHLARVDTSTVATFGHPGLAVATRDALPSGNTINTTVDWSGNTTPVADQAYAIIAAFKSTAGGGDVTPPAAPTGLAALGGAALGNAGIVNLQWDANSESDLAGYNVYRSATSGGARTLMNTSGPVTTPYYDAIGLTDNTTYFFVVRAVDTSNNESGNSNEVSALTGTKVGTATRFAMGGVTDTGAQGVAKFSGVTNVRLVFSTSQGLTLNPIYSPVTAVTSHGWTKANVEGLQPSTRYYWAFERDGVVSLDGGAVTRTFPVAGTIAPFKVAYGSCADAVRNQNPTSMTHVLNRNPQPLFVIHDGDIHYGDVNTAVVADHRAAYDTNLSYPTRQRIWSEIPAVTCWSDHDHCGDASNKNFTGNAAAVQAFRECRPLYPLVDNSSNTAPVYQEPIVVGRCVFFMLDCRSQKDTYNSGTDASRNIIGTAQEDWLVNESANWKNYVKFFISDVPWMAAPVNLATGGYTADDDHWGAYRTQRDRIVSRIKALGVKNIIMMAGDMHCAASDDGGTKVSGVYSAGNFPVFQGAPWARNASFKGDGVGATHPVLYDNGPYPAKGSTAQIEQYGWLEVDDLGGSTVDVSYSAIAGDGTVVVPKMTVTMTLGENIKPDAILEETNDNEVLANFRRDPDLTR